MASKLKQGPTVAAAVGAAAVGGTAIAGATGNRSATQPSETAFTGSTAGERDHRGRGPHGPGRGERPLTGATAEKVRAAALARVKGTVLRVETDRDGVYEAHIRKADGTEVEVKVDRTFKVTAVEAHGHRRP